MSGAGPRWFWCDGKLRRKPGTTEIRENTETPRQKVTTARLAAALQTCPFSFAFSVLSIASVFPSLSSQPTNKKASRKARLSHPSQPQRSSHLDIVRLNPLHAGFFHRLPGGGKRAVQVDAARCILDHGSLEPCLARILGRPCDAIVGRQSADEH